MKKLIVLLVTVGLMGILPVAYVFASSTSAQYNVSATIMAGTATAAFKLYKAPNGGDIDFTNEITTGTINFNAFDVVQATGKAAQWAGRDHYAVVAWVSGGGAQYQVKIAGWGTFLRTGGAETLPANSFACIPVYSSDDQWKMDLNGDGDYLDPGETVAQGAMLGTLAGTMAGITGSAATYSTVYTSENPGSSRIIQVRFAFPPYRMDGVTPFTTYVPIPTTQIAGTYTGPKVQVTVTP